MPFEICSWYIKGQEKLCWVRTLPYLVSPAYYSRTHNLVLALASDHLPFIISPRDKIKKRWLKALNNLLVQHKEKLSNWLVEKVL